MRHLLILALLCALPLVAQSEASQKIVAATDRDAGDQALDGVRKPAHLLDFLDIKPGSRIADLGAGGGYTTELLARAAGPEGKVWAQNPKEWHDFVDADLKKRFEKDVWKNVVRVDQSFATPLPEDAKNLDLVVMVLIYHDVCNMMPDRSAMNKAVFDALKPGGAYVIVDHRAKEGTGTSAGNTIHRIEEKVVHEEVLAAGFELKAEADFLADAEDAHDFMAFGRPKQPSTDRFVLKFVKPAN